MAMPSNARKLVVEDRTYQYVIRAEHGPVQRMRLVIRMPSGKYVTSRFVAKTIPEGYVSAADNWVETHPFRPSDVRAIVDVLEFNKGKLPQPFELENWKAQPSQ